MSKLVVFTAEKRPPSPSAIQFLSDEAQTVMNYLREKYQRYTNTRQRYSANKYLLDDGNLQTSSSCASQYQPSHSPAMTILGHSYDHDNAYDATSPTGDGGGCLLEIEPSDSRVFSHSFRSVALTPQNKSCNSTPIDHDATTCLLPTEMTTGDSFPRFNVKFCTDYVRILLW